MKTLVIHPYDETTKFLSIIYEGKKDWTVITENASKRLIFESLKSHDRIIMLGHGSKYGLIGYDRFMIDSNWVYLLREKYVVAIWCFAEEFVTNYGLEGFYSGMIISELGEAIDFSVVATANEIEESNKLFAETIAKHIEDLTNVDEIINDYSQLKSHVVDFNKTKIFHT